LEKVMVKEMFVLFVSLSYSPMQKLFPQRDIRLNPATSILSAYKTVGAILHAVQYYSMANATNVFLLSLVRSPCIHTLRHQCSKLLQVSTRRRTFFSRFFVSFSGPKLLASPWHSEELAAPRSEEVYTSQVIHYAQGLVQSYVKKL
jgi:hypothetical protein